ncbi:MAG: hypothetical protein WCF93_04080 [Candidatus Moraniibacteriota bacterium]
MNNEQFKSTENTEKQEAHESHEAPKSVEKSAEEIGEQMVEQSEKEVGDFQQEGAADLAQAEARAEKDGLEIESIDKEELQGLSSEAIIAKEDLVAEIGGEIKSVESAESQVEKANIVGAVKDKNFEGSVIVKTQDAEGRVIGYALRKNSKGELEGNKIGYMKDGSVGWVQQIHESGLVELEENGVLEKYEHTSLDTLEEQQELISAEMPDEIVEEELIEDGGVENFSTMKERTIEDPKLLNEKEASKKLLAEERKKLAKEIFAQRKAQRDRLSKLKDVIGIGQEKLEGEQGDKQFGRLSELQSAESNLMAERISSEELSEQDAGAEKENMNQLIENSEKLKSIKEKIEEHYEKAGGLSRERFDTLNRSLEHVMKRNNAFLVHTLTEIEGVRHNENSNVSSEATIEDDIDMLLSLEPSISASSVISGKQSSLWAGGQMGFLLGGGQIGEAGHGDLGTHPDGIKGRKSSGGKDASIEDINNVVSRDNGTHSGMNEVVVHNTEVAGFFQSAERDENGRFWIYGLNTKRHAEKVEQEKKRDYLPQPYTKLLKGNLSRFSEKLLMAEKRGIPQYVMTPTREFFECLSVNDDGSVNIGKQLTPEDVATGRAGLSAEKRKELGKKILEKKIFKKQETHEEAREIINNI